MTINGYSPVDLKAIERDSNRKTVLLIEREGEHRSDSAHQCDQSINCDHTEQFAQNGQTDLIAFRAALDDENASQTVYSAHSNSLPHRPLSEIDIQGHQDTGTAADPCPGRYTYRLPERGEFLYCWGQR